MKIANQSKRVLVSLAFIVLLAFLTYGEILTYYFTDVDSFSLINSGRFNSIAGAAKVAQSELMAGRMVNAIYYRPMTSLTFGATYLVSGMSPLGYHFLDLSLFTATAFLVFLLGRLLLGEHRGHFLGLTAATLFILHPVQVDNVPAIARLGDLLVGFFAALSLAAFICFLQKRTDPRRYLWYGVAVAASFLGLCSKEPGAVMPGVLGLAAIIYGPQKKLANRLGQAILWMVPFAILAIFFLYTRWSVLGGVGGYVSNRGLFADPEVLQVSFRFQSTVLGHLLGLILPILSDNYDALAFFFMARSWLIILGVLGLAALSFPRVRRMLHQVLEHAFTTREEDTRRDQRALALFVAFLLLHACLLFFTLFTVRYLYLSTIPFSLLLGFAVLRAWEMDGHSRRRQIRLAVTACVLLLIFAQSPLWYKNRLRRWKVGGEISRQYLTDLAIEAAHEPSDRLYLLNVPYVLLYGRSTPVFWEVPFNQILLEHAIVDYLALRQDETQEAFAEVVALNFLYLTREPKDLQISTQRQSPQEILITISQGAILSPFPWSRIPGRDPYQQLYELEGGRINFQPEPANGWPNEMRIRLKPEALSERKSRFLAYDGRTLQSI